MSPITKIHVTSGFEKSLKNLLPQIRKLTQKRDKWFRANPYDVRLKTHHLKGELKGFSAYSISYKYRILFRFIRPDEVIYYDIGTHEIYR